MTRRRLLLRSAWQSSARPAPGLEAFFNAVAPVAATRRAALAELKAGWRDSYAGMLIELVGFVRRPQRLDAEAPSAADTIRNELLAFVGRQTGQNPAFDLPRWQRWIWSLPYDPHPGYAEFKGALYSNIDPRMRDFFPSERALPARIRLDQVQWGGVSVNGIPPLVSPAMVTAREADYLKDNHVVFGVAKNGDARAYPKRILAWHELARDTVGGEPLAIVYCTLCGTVIPYRAGRHVLGTSGLLYESSKLMFDEATKSLWSTLQGEPVIGPLAHSGIRLEYETVVTTTWGEWRRENPDTRVLSLETGHARDYSEGAAYRAYFGTQELMFEVSRRDSRLKNKDEVLAIRLAGKRPLAVAVKHLRKTPEWRYIHEGAEILIRTKPGGASLALVDGKPVATHQAFWFGWFTQFPDTVLAP
jgi:hypothetical protein